jgi:hypothetical protein
MHACFRSPQWSGISRSRSRTRTPLSEEKEKTQSLRLVCLLSLVAMVEYLEESHLNSV